MNKMYFCRSIKIVCWVIVIPCGIYGAQVREVTGELAITRYDHSGEVSTTSDGPFELSWTPTMYRIKMRKATVLIEQGIYIICDGKSIFQSERATELNGRKGRSNATSTAHGRIDLGLMPEGFYGWAPAQML